MLYQVSGKGISRTNNKKARENLMQLGKREMMNIKMEGVTVVNPSSSLVVA